MELFIVFVLIFITFVLSLYLLLSISNRRPKNFPPGPDGIPLFGNIFQLGKEDYKAVLEMREKYGDIIGLKIGARWTVWLTDVDDMKKAFGRPEFAGRKWFNPWLDKNCDEHTPGVVMSEGKTWSEQRRFCLRTLRDFGFGKKTMETVIMEEANDLIEELKRKKGQPITTSHTFHCSVFNVLWSIVAGERYPHDDPQLAELLDLLLIILSSAHEGFTPFYFVFPALVDLRDKLPSLFPDGKKFRTKMFEFMRTTIEKHRETMEVGNPRDLIDTYLEEMAKAKNDPTSSFYNKNNDDEGLIVLLMDLFVAGAETTSTTLIWSCFLLALHKDVQEKCHKEIQTVVGDRQVSLTDRPSLPYVEATMLEIMRLSTLAPRSIPHSVTEDTTIKDYFIPKDTLVFSCTYASHYNSSVWGDPHNFRPERFLSPDGKTVVRSKNLIPFGVGKRVCPGESLAKDEFYLFLTNLVQTFYIEMPEDEPEHTLRLIPGGVATPEKHKIVLKERNA